MKKLLILAIVLLVSQSFLWAQTPDPELDYIKKVYSKEKKTIVDEYMELDVQQGAKFCSINGSNGLFHFFVELYIQFGKIDCIV